MTDRPINAPRRYFVDGTGHRVLIGLSLAETVEFESLESAAFASPVVLTGASQAGEPTRLQETRWLELYAKHEQAWKAWIALSRAKQAVDLWPVNYN
jgi:hypothetical protein